MDAPAKLHPTDQTLSSYGLGKLDDALAEAVNQHLESCPDCRRRVAALSSDRFLGRLRDAQAQGRPDSPAPLISSTAGLSMLASGDPSVAGAAPGQQPAAGPRRSPRLQNPPRAGPGRHGCGLSGGEHAHGAEGSAQGRRQPPRQPPRRARSASSARSAMRPDCTTPTWSPPMRSFGSARASSWPWSTSMASTWRGWSRPAARCPWPTPAITCTRRPWVSSTLTKAAWSIATSSPATSCCRARAAAPWSRCSTSG